MGSGDGLGGCHACIKYLMFAFNFIFWLVGCAIVGVGIWILVDDGFKQLAADSAFNFLQYAGIGLVVVGSIVMIVGFFGCCGAIRESQCLLVMFFICMLVLFLALVAAGVAVMVYKGPLIETMKDQFVKRVETGKANGEVEPLMKIVQSFFKCCGAESALDYGLEGAAKNMCQMEMDDFDFSALQGCNTVVPEKLKTQFTLIAGVSLGAGALMLLGMIFSMLLCCAIRDSE